jgi:hypothetical protein
MKINRQAIEITLSTLVFVVYLLFMFYAVKHPDQFRGNRWTTRLELLTRPQ